MEDNYDQKTGADQRLEVTVPSAAGGNGSAGNIQQDIAAPVSAGMNGSESGMQQNAVAGQPMSGWIRTPQGGMISPEYLPGPMPVSQQGKPEKKRSLGLIIAIAVACLVVMISIAVGGIMYFSKLFHQFSGGSTSSQASRNEDEEDEDDDDMQAATAGGGYSGNINDPGNDGANQMSQGGKPASTPIHADEGPVLNIYCWNEDLKNLMEQYYPGYEIDEQRIGNVDVVWNIYPSYDGSYQDMLDMSLMNPVDPYDSVDLFVLEADFAMKYTETSYTMPITDLGIDMSELREQFPYTHDVATDSNGDLKALSWMASPGVMIYNREIALEVLGTDDPDEVQTLVSDWESYYNVADMMAAKGYLMTATAEDTLRVYNDNRSSAWVENNSINIDPHIYEWAQESQKLYQKGCLGSGNMWEAAWYNGFEGGVFCYFGPSWFYEYCMLGTVTDQGGWGVCQGPEPFFWGGTWIAVASNTDNAGLIEDILRTLTIDRNTLTEVAELDGEFVNNISVMQDMENSSAWHSSVLGGQNAVGQMLENGKQIRVRYATPYDYDCFWQFGQRMEDYIGGGVSYDEASEDFFEIVQSTHPNLSY